jgi:hypothetical protein
MKRIFALLMPCLFLTAQPLHAAPTAPQEMRQLFIQLSFSTSNPAAPLIKMRTLRESPERTIQNIRIKIARSLGIWPSLIKASDRKGRPLPDYLKIGYEIGNTTENSLHLFVNVGIQKMSLQGPESEFAQDGRSGEAGKTVDSSFLQ